MKPLPSTAVSSLLLVLTAILTTIRPVSSGGIFHVVAFYQNVSELLLEEMDNRSSSTMEYLYQFLENCTVVEAGTLIPGRERYLELEEEEHATGEVEEEMGRELLGGCPPRCSSSGSRYCRSIGCAYCGRCGRRRRGRGRKLQTTVTAALVGMNGSPISAYPLGVCQADCDVDSQCQSGLRCWRRDFGQPLPSPCAGRSIDNSDDYCVPAPASAVTATRPGNNGSPASAFPLGICQGDCDFNGECAPGLICHQRNAGDPLPSPCWGGSVVTSDATDYCIPAPKPPTKAPTSRPTRFPTQAPTAKPTLEIDSTADLLGQDIDEDFNDFLKSPNMTADKIEQRLDRHANFYYCELNNATAQGCKIWYKILHVLDNGTSYPLTGYPIE